MRQQVEDAIRPSRRSLLLAGSWLPIMSLALMAACWLTFGVDLPFRDDWREYISGQIGSLELSHLFRPDNDTISVTTRVFDALAYRYLGGNSIAYQLFSMLAVLGGLLWLQWKLLGKVTRSRAITAAAFVATLFMLQPDSYWGRQNLAYIQAVPILAILAALYVALFSEIGRLRIPVVFLLVLFSGLTYISGALSSFAASVVLLAGGLLAKERRREILGPGLGFMAASAITTALQLWVIIGAQGGKTHRADATWALPTDLDFWMYMAGKIARSALLPQTTPAISLAITAGLVAAVVTVVVLAWRQASALRDGEDGMHALRTALFLTSLCAVVATYLCIISAGRANLRPESVQAPLAVFQYGYQRFHFFWASVLWPWLVAGACLFASRRLKPGAAGKTCLAAGLAVALQAFFGGAFAHAQYFRQIESQRMDDMDCLRSSLMHSDRIDCPAMAPYRHVKEGYRFAVATSASFVRYFPPSLLLDNDGIHPFISVLDRGLGAVSVRNTAVDAFSENALTLAAGQDVQLHFQTGAGSVVSSCVMLKIEADIRARRHDTAQLFFQPIGTQRYSKAHSKRVALPGMIRHRATFVLESESGFRDAFRLDPVAGSQAVEVSSITMRCLL